MKAKLKVIITLATVLCLTFSVDTGSLAATESKQENSQFTIMALECPNCPNGRLVPHVVSYEPFFVDSYVCPDRNDCLVKVYRTDRVEVAECSNCDYGYSLPLDSIYTYQHNIVN